MRLVIFLILSFLFPAVNAAVDPQLCAKLAQWQASGLDRADIEGKLQGLGLDTKVAESCNRAAAKGRPVPTPTEQAHGDRTQKTIRTANELAAALKGNTDVGVSAPNNGAQNTIRGDRPVRLAVAVASDLSRTPPPAPEGLIQMAQDRMNPIYAQRKFETSRQLELDQARRAVTCASWTSLACARGTLDVGAEYLSLALDALGEKFTGNSGNAEVARFAYDSTPIGGAHRGLEGVYQEPASKMAWAGLGLGLIGLGGLREGLAVERAAVTAAREVAPTAEAARVAASVARVETPIEGGLGIVIDGNLYHGSATSGMKQFDSAAAAAERTVKSDGSATLGHGIYLASDRKAAESYAHIRAEDVNATTPGAGRAPIVYSVASEKLRFLDLSVPGNKAIIRDEYKAYLLARANGAGGATAQEASLAKILASSIDRNPNGFDVHINRAEFTTFLRSRGYDGIVGVAFGEPTVDGTKEFFDHDQYVVFNPAKAKITGEARLPSRTTAPVAIAREVELDGGFVVKLEGKHLFHGSMMAGVKQFDLATGEA